MSFSLQAFAGHFLCINPKPQPIESSAFLSILSLLVGQAEPEDFVIYLMVTAEVGLPDAV